VTSQSWDYSGGPQPVEAGGRAQTLVEGSTFCISAAGGDILEGGAYGLFFRDVRSLSRWELRVDGHRPQLLSAYWHEPFSATFVSRVPPPPGLADSHLLVVRHRYVADGMREDVEVRNLGAEAATCTVTVLLDADFADLFEVKENRVVPRRDRTSAVATADAAGVRFSYRWMGHSRDVVVSSDASPHLEPGVLTFSATIAARSTWRTALEVRVSVDGVPVEPGYGGPHATGHARASRQRRQWTDRAPVLTTPHDGLDLAFRTGSLDLGSLRINDPEDPGRHVVAAGAPWFMTVFGRDSLLTAWMALPLDPGLARGTLEVLARYQGTRTDPRTEEQPGRILHEMRFGSEAALALGGSNVYYGTADATALFVMLLGEARDWGLADEHLAALLPHADAALAWITGDGDRDGDGFVEYQRATSQGLVNQGWKDSFDGVSFANGALANAPIALCEVQAYSYGAFRARARLARGAGDTATADRWETRAASLKSAFNEAFWLPETGSFAVALDGDKRPVDALTSNLGHCLWTGIVDEDRAASVVAHLLSPEMASGYGVRTLASSMGAYNPVSYHNGSVWPHDNALLIAGLMRYGFVHEAQQVALSLLEAAVTFGGRLPELWSGFERTEFPAPLPYPTSCSPQAWAAASPLLVLRSLLGLHARLPEGRLAIAPALPAELLPLTLDNLRIGDMTLHLRVDSEGYELKGVPDGITVVSDHREL
jgi:glycogen debranching enzyme